MVSRNFLIKIFVLVGTEVFLSQASTGMDKLHARTMSAKIRASGVVDHVKHQRQEGLKQEGISTSLLETVRHQALQESQQGSLPAALMRAEQIRGANSLNSAKYLSGHEVTEAIPDHWVAIYSVFHRRYICMNDHAEMIGSRQMPFNNGNFPTIWWWCVFKVIDLGDKRVGFHHGVENRFIKMGVDGNATVSSKIGEDDLPTFEMGPRFQAVYIPAIGAGKGSNWDKYGGMTFFNEKCGRFLSMMGSNKGVFMGSSEKASAFDMPRSWIWARFKLLDFDLYEKTTTAPPATNRSAPAPGDDEGRSEGGKSAGPQPTKKPPENAQEPLKVKMPTGQPKYKVGGGEVTEGQPTNGSSSWPTGQTNGTNSSTSNLTAAQKERKRKDKKRKVVTVNLTNSSMNHSAEKTTTNATSAANASINQITKLTKIVNAHRTIEA